ncbi:MAG TPA: NADH-quinone oxidoreductase subunit I [Planctomycetota bacterium]|nr:NADH-quinone oxidoreductase subunit I [Planctomycetota bacterium]
MSTSKAPDAPAATAAATPAKADDHGAHADPAAPAAHSHMGGHGVNEPSIDPRVTDFGIQSYLPAALTGLKNTLRHVFTSKSVTLQYPEVKEVHPPGYRGEHYLKKDSEGHVRCVACYMCATACPANCIHIEAAQAPADWTDRDKFPARFEIDMLRCIYCGMCEEACPCDAIALSPVHNVVAPTRLDKIFDKKRLLANGDAVGEMAKSKFEIEGHRRGDWSKDRELPPIPAHEKAIIEGRV